MDGEVLRFIERATATAEVSALNDAFARTMRCFGIDKFAAAIMSPSKMRPEYFLATNYPSAWIQHYIDNGYEAVDPVVQRSCAHLEPFLWHERLAPWPARKLFHEAMEVGIVSGLSVPIRLNSGRMSAVVVCSGMRPNEFEPLMSEWIDSLKNAIYCYHDSLCELTGLDAPRAQPIPPLEAEVLRWLAAGKRPASIAETLYMAECSVQAHLTNAMKRFNLASRDHLVVEAIRRGFLVN